MTRMQRAIEWPAKPRGGADGMGRIKHPAAGEKPEASYSALLKESLAFREGLAARYGPVLIAFVRALPIDAASGFGGWLFKTLGPLTGVNRTALRNLKIAFPEWDEPSRQRLAKAQWENFGRVLIEFFLILWSFRVVSDTVADREARTFAKTVKPIPIIRV